MYVTEILISWCKIAGTYVGEGMVIHFSRGEGKESGTGTILDRLLISSSPLHANFDIPCPRCGDQN